MDNVDNPKTFWHACAFGLLARWKSFGWPREKWWKTAVWRACGGQKDDPSGKSAGIRTNLQGRKTPKDAKMHAQNRLSTLSTDSTIPQKWMKNVRVFKGFWFWRTRYPQTYPLFGEAFLPRQKVRRAGRRAAPSYEWAAVPPVSYDCKIRQPNLNSRKRNKGQL